MKGLLERIREQAAGPAKSQPETTRKGGDNRRKQITKTAAAADNQKPVEGVILRT